MSGKIDHQLFSAHEHALNSESCPQCQQGTLQLKNGKHGPFFGCSDYPGCDYIKPLHQNDGHVIKTLGVACPDCGSELLLRQGRYGMFIGCSGYPECHFIQSPNKQEENKPQKDAEVACPECAKGQLIERKSRFGKVFYACDAYPKCKFAINHPPITGDCEFCGYPLLTEKKRASGTVFECASRACHKVQSEKTAL
ncbi:topoisomerase DNA-binding C4 zinc finger domain-containing protein [Vibrio sp. 10N.261.51.F12]|uniref:DNA topoisomerase family protein n=1 Tax=Vibrio sp. 10N.261.51.F12 TaxID=3229679 RepID=UPI00354B9285